MMMMMVLMTIMLKKIFAFADVEKDLNKAHAGTELRHLPHCRQSYYAFLRDARMLKKNDLI